MTTCRVAVVQAAPRLFDRPETLRRFKALLAQAAATGAHLVVFPEAFVGGYPKGSTLGASVGRRTDEGRELFARYRRSAVEIPGEAFEEMSAAVAAQPAHVVVGVVERSGRTLYCTALLFAPDGTLLARHRKLVPTGTERVIWGRGDASDVVVADTDLGRIGLAICWESYMPLYRTALYQRDVQIYCAPTVDDRDVWTSTMRHIAVEGRCFVVSANQFAGSDDRPPGFPAADPALADSAAIQGGSCVVNPFGDLLAGPSFGRQDLLVTDLDLAVLDGACLDLDVVGHYARPDLFRLRTFSSEP